MPETQLHCVSAYEEDANNDAKAQRNLHSIMIQRKQKQLFTIRDAFITAIKPGRRRKDSVVARK